MWDFIANPKKVYQEYNAEEKKRLLIFLLAANVLLLALASILVGSTLYGISFALSLPLWLLIWLVLITVSWSISTLIGSYILRIKEQPAYLGETLIIYGLAYSALPPIIIFYLLLELLVAVWGGIRIALPLIIILGFGRYFSFVSYGLKIRYRLLLGERVMTVAISLLPQLFFLLFLKRL